MLTPSMYIVVVHSSPPSLHVFASSSSSAAPSSDDVVRLGSSVKPFVVVWLLVDGDGHRLLL